MALFQRCFAAVVILLLALPIIAVAQKDEPQEPVGKDLELKACGPKHKVAKYSADTDKSQHPTGTPTADAGLIYVVKPTRLSAPLKLAVDAEWKGVNRGNAYFFFMLPPGEHYFCSTDGATRRTLVLTVEAGKTYYLEQRAHPLGPFGWAYELVSVEDEEGKKEVADANLSTFRPK